MTELFSLGIETILVLAALIILIAVFVWLKFFKPKRELLVQAEYLPDGKYGKEIEFMGFSDSKIGITPAGYSGFVKKTLRRSNGSLSIELEDKLSNSSFTIHGVVEGFNLINKGGAEDTVNKGKLFCNVDATSIHFPWENRFYQKYFQGRDIILESQIEEEVKRKVDAWLEYREQRTTATQALNFEKTAVKKLEALGDRL